jgi:alpha-galactosidase
MLSLLLSLLLHPPIQSPSAPPNTVRVFLLAGQSNMEGHGLVPADPQRNSGKGSLEYLAETRPDSPFAKLRKPDGDWLQRDDVFIHYLDRKGPLQPGFGARPDRIGPELGFGTVIGDAGEDPVVLLKLAWGGKSLAVDFRPPSAGAPGTGAYYKEVVDRTHQFLKNFDTEFPELAGRKPILSGIAWHQGWNDRINQAFNDEYASNLAHLIRDLRRDLNAPDLPFVIAETGMSGPNEKHPRALSLMKAQASVPALDEFKSTTAFVPTRHLYQPPESSPLKQEYHWNGNAETYYSIGHDMALAMLKLIPK